jgi:hypothetical protein
MNDNGTMVQVAVTDLAAYFDDEITAMPNLVTTAATTVGALASGSIAAGFGAIDNGTSGITTGGNLVIDVDADANDNTTDSAAGRLAIGASGDLNLFHNTHSYIVNKTGNLKFHTETDDSDIIFSGEDGASGITALTLDMSAAGTAEFNSNIYAGGGYMGLNTGDRIHFTDNTSAIIEVNGAEKLAVLANGDVDVESGDIFFSTAGKGIVLGATSNVAANTLDDYEEGTFTPQLATASVDIGAGGSSGHYTKIGNMVYCHFVVLVNNKNSASGMLQIHDLPFTINNDGYGSAEVNSGVISFANNITSRDYGGGVILRCNNGTAIIEMKYSPGGAVTALGGADFNAEDIAANTFMSGNFYYRT